LATKKKLAKTKKKPAQKKNQKEAAVPKTEATKKQLLKQKKKNAQDQKEAKKKQQIHMAEREKGDDGA